MSARALALLLAVSMALSPRVAFAVDDAERNAARQFVEGQRAFSSKEYRRAAELFEGAYRDKPHYAALWNAARSWHRAGEDVRAANLYAHYLRDAPADAPDRDQANAALRELTARTGRVELRGDRVSRLRIDGVETDAAITYVTPGDHVAEGDGEDGIVRKPLRVQAGELVTVRLAPAPPAASPPEDPSPDPPSPPDEPSRPASGGLSPVFTVAGAVLTAAGAGLTIASGLDTVSKRDAFLVDRTQARLDDAFASQTRTNVFLGVTVGLALATGVIAVFFTDWKGSDTAKQGRLGPRALVPRWEF